MLRHAGQPNGRGAGRNTTHVGRDRRSPRAPNRSGSLAAVPGSTLPEIVPPSANILLNPGASAQSRLVTHSTTTSRLRGGQPSIFSHFRHAGPRMQKKQWSGAVSRDFGRSSPRLFLRQTSQGAGGVSRMESGAPHSMPRVSRRDCIIASPIRNTFLPTDEESVVHGFYSRACLAIWGNVPNTPFTANSVRKEMRPTETSTMMPGGRGCDIPGNRA